MRCKFRNWLFMEVVMKNKKITGILTGTKRGLAMLVIVTVYGLSSCKKMDATYRDYVKGGEIVYVSKADSVKIYPGNNRMLLTWWKGTDPKVSLARVFGEDGQLLKEQQVGKGVIGQWQEVLLEDMPEGTYSLDVVTVDDNGNTSIKVTVPGISYGPRYEASLQTRRLEQAVYLNGNAYVNWRGPTPDAIATEIVYEDIDGREITVRTPAGENQTALEKFKSRTRFKYRTLFKPASTSIDTFYSEYVDVELEYLLDKAKFKRWNTADFPYTEYEMGSIYNIERLWDEVYTEYGYIYLETEPLPRSFTFDLGQLARIERIRLSPNWSSQLYKNGNIKKAEIWGSATPDVSADFSTWTYLGTLESFKPSGLPLGESTPADLAYAQAGENFQLVDDAPPIRYIRFVVQETWSGSISMHITELTFWGDVIEP